METLPYGLALFLTMADIHVGTIILVEAVLPSRHVAVVVYSTGESKNTGELATQLLLLQNSKMNKDIVLSLDASYRKGFVFPSLTIF